MQILYGKEAREKLKAGIDKVADAVCVTLGPAGRCVVMGKSIPTPHGVQHYTPDVTKDGISVARQIILDDHCENIGAMLIKDASEKTVQAAGDGTTTCILLTRAIVKEALKMVDNNANPVEIKRELEKECAYIVDKLKSMAIPVGGDIEKIRQVATVSANNDPSIGDLIAQAFEKIGMDGMIDIEEAKGVKTEIKVTDGFKFDRGYLSPYFITNQAKNECELIDPYILLYDKKLTQLKPLQGVLEHVIKEQKPLLIICDDADGQALAGFTMNATNGSLRSCIVKCPEFTETKREAMEDLAVVTGAKYINEEKGVSLENADGSYLGRAAKVVISKEDTVIISGNKNPKALTELLNDLKMNLVKAEGEEKIKIEKRIARLQGGIAVLSVGAPTETEMKERKDRCDDAIRATKSAIAEGYVPGAGTAFLRVKEVKNSILKEVLKEPLRQICANAGVDGEQILAQVLNLKDSMGYNAKTDKIEDLIGSGIIDPVKVLRCSLENAVSAAGMIITSQCLTHRVI